MFQTKNLPDSLRPYEKCEAMGAQALSDAELLAVILRTGTAGQNSLELSIHILDQCGENRSIAGIDDLSLEELRDIKGVGRVKALQLKCLMEFSRRLWRVERVHRKKFLCPKDCADYYMEELRHLKTEVIYVPLLDTKCSFLGDFKLSEGTANASLISAREIFTRAVKKGAVKIMLVHNHPSGDPTPSKEDIEATERVLVAGKIMDMALVDSIIIGDGVYVSLREKGLVNFD